MKCGTCQEQIEEDIELPHGGMCKSCMKKTIHRLEKEDAERGRSANNG